MFEYWKSGISTDKLKVRAVAAIVTAAPLTFAFLLVGAGLISNVFVTIGVLTWTKLLSDLIRGPRISTLPQQGSDQSGRFDEALQGLREFWLTRPVTTSPFRRFAVAAGFGITIGIGELAVASMLSLILPGAWPAFVSLSLVLFVFYFAASYYTDGAEYATSAAVLKIKSGLLSAFGIQVPERTRAQRALIRAALRTSVAVVLRAVVLWLIDAMPTNWIFIGLIVSIVIFLILLGPEFFGLFRSKPHGTYPPANDSRPHEEEP